jgi:fluoroacetyl-CoA thioesterase
MKASLKPGLSKTIRIAVDRGRTIGFMGDDGRVYSTPSMVLDFEYSTRDFLMEHLDPGEDSVGAHVSVDHLGPTLEGDTVEFILSVAEVEGRRVTVEGTMRDSVEQVGRGIHKRFIVDVARQHARLAAKRAKLKSV